MTDNLYDQAADAVREAHDELLARGRSRGAGYKGGPDDRICVQEALAVALGYGDPFFFLSKGVNWILLDRDTHKAELCPMGTLVHEAVYATLDEMDLPIYGSGDTTSYNLYQFNDHIDDDDIFFDLLANTEKRLREAGR